MTKLQFIISFFEEFKNNGFSDICKAMIVPGLFEHLPKMLPKVEGFVIQTYSVEQFTYEKVTRKVKATDTTPEIPRSVETKTSLNKFLVVLNDKVKFKMFVHGTTDNDYKISGVI